MQPQPMKLALMSSQGSWGGGEQFLWSLGVGLQSRGHSILWVCDEQSPLFARVKAEHFPCVAINGRTPNPQSVLQLRRECTEKKIQLLHVNDSHALTWGSLAMLGKLGLKRVGVKHTIFPIRSAVRYNWLLDKVVCVSNAVRNSCIDGGVSAKKTHVIHGGIEPPELDKAYERFHACETLGISNETPLFCAVGSLIPCKGYDRLIEAASILRWTLPNFMVVICGEGKSRPQLEQLIRKHNLHSHVRLLGFQESPERWITAADSFVHPTLSEGLSLVTIQSQMIGTPVVATEVGGLREVMRSPENNAPLGFVIEQNEPEEIASLMFDSIQNSPELKNMVRRAQGSSIARFHIDCMLDGFESLYAGLLSKQMHPSFGMAKPRAA